VTATRLMKLSRYQPGREVIAMPASFFPISRSLVIIAINSLSATGVARFHTNQITARSSAIPPLPLEKFTSEN